MKIFIDSIDLAEIKKYQDMGLIDGVTTNPGLMPKSLEHSYDIGHSICELVRGDVSIQVVSDNFDDMIGQGERISKIGSNAVIKLPITRDGLKACKHFSSHGKKVNMTLCFSVSQAILAAKAGAAYVSPFIGRLEDSGEDGIQLISDIRLAYNNYDFKTKILAASVRSKEHVELCAIYGADYITLAPKIMAELAYHDLTEKGLERFTKDGQQSE